MDVISNIIDEIDAMEYEEIVHKLVVHVIEEAENEIARDLEKKCQTKENAQRLLDDIIRDALYHEENTKNAIVTRTRLLTNGSLSPNKSDTSLLKPTQRNCVTIGIGLAIQPQFTKSTLFETYAIKAQDMRSTPTFPAVIEVSRDQVHIPEVSKAEAKKEVDTDRKWQGVDYIVQKKSLLTRLRKFCTRLFGCCLSQNGE